MSEAAAPVRKLIDGTRLKLRLAGAAALVLALGALLAPPARRAQPQEKAAPILQAELQRREPARVFRGVQETGRKAIPFTVALHVAASETPARTYPDFAVTKTLPEPPAGFGIVVSVDGEALTHVSALGGSGRSKAETSEGWSTVARVLAYEPETGLVLARLEGARFTRVAPLARAEPVAGELIVAAGQSGGRSLVAPVFVASNDGDRYTISAASGVVVPGTPLFNLEGEVVAVAGGAPALSVAYPVGRSLERLRERMAQGGALPASIGAFLQTMSPALAERLGPGAALVADLRPRGPAARAGLRAGDVILAVGTEEPAGLEGTSLAIARLEAGQPATLRLRRAGVEQEVELTPEGTTFPPATSTASADPPATAPRARELFSVEQRRAAGLPDEARVLTVNGVAPPRSGRLGDRWRGGPPWLAHAQTDQGRFFAVVAAPAR